MGKRCRISKAKKDEMKAQFRYCPGCGKTREQLMSEPAKLAKYGESGIITIEHIIPLSRGGTDDIDNIMLLCRNCNSGKGDKLLSEMKHKFKGAPLDLMREPTLSLNSFEGRQMIIQAGGLP